MPFTNGRRKSLNMLFSLVRLFSLSFFSLCYEKQKLCIKRAKYSECPLTGLLSIWSFITLQARCKALHHGTKEDSRLWATFCTGPLGNFVTMDVTGCRNRYNQFCSYLRPVTSPGGAAASMCGSGRRHSTCRWRLRRWLGDKIENS